ncbi:hypothetical protein B7P43_G09291 [Cryptotermes secundus]|uniref:CREG-like beta-barrel domain-containing protein n=1 Tax=Cryptotermes secundus TaxID=105785 RepID=A0A2J7Q5Z4_9NEOP|nr:hypothetical protein B7P43_G09291 [Cryptotermes secundus]
MRLVVDVVTIGGCLPGFMGIDCMEMYQLLLALLVTALCVNSLTMYGSHNVNILVLNMSDQEDEGNSNFSGPPKPSEVAKMARYIMHNSNWSVFAYKSRHPKTSEFPLGTTISVSDGPLGNGKGTPYMYVSEVEEAVQDTDKDSRCSLTMTLAQGDYCKQKKLDPQFPTCAQVTLIGRRERVSCVLI